MIRMALQIDGIEEAVAPVPAPPPDGRAQFFPAGHIFFRHVASAAVLSVQAGHGIEFANHQTIQVHRRRRVSRPPATFRII
jgi:hypothetical protein